MDNNIWLFRSQDESWMVDKIVSLVQESAVWVGPKKLDTDFWQFLSGDHLQAAFQSIDDPDVRRVIKLIDG